MTAEQAKRVADKLFVNGQGQEAQRLVLTSSDGKDLGGWCKQAIIDQLTTYSSTDGDAVMGYRDAQWKKAICAQEQAPVERGKEGARI